MIAARSHRSTRGVSVPILGGGLIRLDVSIYSPGDALIGAACTRRGDAPPNVGDRFVGHVDPERTDISGVLHGAAHDGPSLAQ